DRKGFGSYQAGEPCAVIELKSSDVERQRLKGVSVLGVNERKRFACLGKCLHPFVQSLTSADSEGRPVIVVHACPFWRGTRGCARWVLESARNRYPVSGLRQRRRR